MARRDPEDERETQILAAVDVVHQDLLEAMDDRKQR
jgi:hypothetical protein